MSLSRRYILSEHNLGLDLMRATEAAALSAGRWAGRGDKNSGDKAAVDAMRHVLNQVRMDGTIVIGEGEKDEAPMLANGEKVGTGEGPKIDIAVDPWTAPVCWHSACGTRSPSWPRPRRTMLDPHVLLHGEAGGGCRGVDVIDLDVPRREHPPCRKGQGQEG